ncbi:MAG: YqgE/AlgH family protein [Cypionkella sp.]|uniref:YqgE/AlgH family protein n=1 Tax=Cypionkella sp. TaxID=2811411 RepID=UPI002630B3F0|nr:YqgE/AlgH family protein [Cypionkella sp.]MDB5658216.1 YqgE/AlgH family protein [Cypionkella sp.]MDB5666699.1 YqgE/AlgH family protein [Cypionkella sp.]
MDLCGKLLVAMPGMGDPRFEHSVILVCAHTPEGAMGLIINKLLPDMSFGGLLEHLDIPLGDASRSIAVHFGGPVERGRGFVLHSPDYVGGPATLQIEGGYGMTATLDVLEAIAQGQGPDKALLALGYTGWGPGQLEVEITRNDWLTVEPTAALIFAENSATKWAGALRGMGIEPLSLSATSGRA